MVDLKQKEFDDLIKDITSNGISKKSSVILDRIEKISSNPDQIHAHSDHDSHCQFDRDGGGHGNVCWSENEQRDIIGNNEGE